MASAGRLKHRRPQRGIVLLTTLLVLALLAALAWQMLGRHTILIAQYRQGFAGDQALAYALGAETFARQILYQDWAEGGPGKDTLLEQWAQAAPPFDVDNGSIEIRARDLNRCFNLNSAAGTATSNGGQDDNGGGAGGGGNLIEPDSPPEDAGATGQPDAGAGGESPAMPRNQQRLRQLLRNLGLPDALADSWRDWIDADQEPTGFGAEDGDYLLADPGYRTANRLAGDVSELRLLRDIEPAMADMLEPLVCVLPTDKLRLNVNTASAEVLAALDPAVDASALASFVEAPRDLDDVGQFTAQFPELATAVDALAVTSEYFAISIRAQVDDARVEMLSLLRRDPDSGQLEVLGRDLSRNYQNLFLAGPPKSESKP